MKKITAIIVSMMLSGTLLVGCSSGKGSSDSQLNTLSASITNSETKAINENIQNLENKDKFLKSKEGHDFQVVSWKFAKAFLSGDINRVKIFLIDSKNDFSLNQQNLFNNVEFLILKLDPKDIKQDTVIAEYEFGLKGQDSLQYLNLEMKRVNNEWKIKSFGLEM